MTRPPLFTRLKTGLEEFHQHLNNNLPLKTTTIETMEFKIPDFALVLLIGPTGAGKSTFAAKHFLPTEIVSSDQCRALIADDATASVSSDAHQLIYQIVEKRLKNRKLTVIDATNVKVEDRRPLLELARQYHCTTCAIVFNFSEKVCETWNNLRNKKIRGNLIAQQRGNLRKSLKYLRKDFKLSYVFKTPEELDTFTLLREKLNCDLRHLSLPLDIIGDVHGCYNELVALLTKLGYSIQETTIEHPANRKVVFLGNLIKYGPESAKVVELVHTMVQQGKAFCLPGEHDNRFIQALRTENAERIEEYRDVLTQFDALPSNRAEELLKFLTKMPSHYVFDDGKLVVAHAGLREDLQNRISSAVYNFALFGTTEQNAPKEDWATHYRGFATVLYGHTPVEIPQWINKTLCIDTGCVFGGSLTAFRYPEQELVAVTAAQEYAIAPTPFKNKDLKHTYTAQQEADDLLNLDDVLTKRSVQTNLLGSIPINENQAHAALETITRFAVNPKWLIYIPPTMSPPASSILSDYLEHPTEAFQYFKENGITQVICEEKHMGSRAIVILCKDQTVAQKRFGILEDQIGVCITRTGREFFTNLELRQAFLEKLQTILTTANFWETHQTDWVCLDAELLPWSAKAKELIREQYAATGTAGKIALTAIAPLLEQAQKRGLNLERLQEQFTERLTAVEKFITAYENYCWTTEGLEGIKFAPFHILATEGHIHTNKSHLWHMEELAKLAVVDSFCLATKYHVVDLTNVIEQEKVIKWWVDLTNAGGEGMVVKPLNFTMRGPKGLVQPAIKVRGKEYLRIIYGPEYLIPKYLEQLKKRNIATKRSLALREYALGIEALERFIRCEPLRRIHECSFGILALESEPIDPRL